MENGLNQIEQESPNQADPQQETEQPQQPGAYEPVSLQDQINKIRDQVAGLYKTVYGREL